MRSMLAFWIKPFCRNLRRHRSFTVINIACLSFGLACTLFAAIYIHNELVYDQFHIDKDRIFRISSINHFNDQETRYSTTAAPLADAIRTDVPEVEAVARLYSRQGSVQLLAGNQSPDPNQKYRENNICFADPQLFDILDFTFLKGYKKTALQNPSQVILTRTLATRYFGSPENAMGKTILFEAQIPLTVSAVIDDYPTQSHLAINLIAHFENYFTIETEGARDFLRRDWLYNPVATYVKLHDANKLSSVSKKLTTLAQRYGDDRVKQSVSYELQPITDIHLYSNLSFEGSSANIRQVMMLGAVSVFILIIACVNFINLSTVSAMRRAREMGMRKALGATRQGLIYQILAESGLMVLFAFFVGITMVALILPYTTALTGRLLSVSTLTEPAIILFTAGLLVLTSLLAGTYPAFYVARFNPAKTLKGLVSNSFKDGINLRRGLVVAQFIITVILIVISITIHEQLAFMKNKPLGFQKELMVTIPIFSDSPNSILGSGVDGPLRARMNEFENKLLESPAVEAVTVSSVLPGSGAIAALTVNDKYSADDNMFVPVVSVDYDFIKSYNMSLIAGREFSREFGTDHLQAFILNEEAVKALGWKTPAEAIGQPLEALDKKGTVIGVIRNYHFEGLQQQLRPLMMEVAASKFTTFTVRITNHNIPETLDMIKSKWNAAFPERVFEYHFLDEQLGAIYNRDRQTASLISYFSFMAILLSCMGLFGLAAYVNYLRIKEVSIRKVLGANERQVFGTLSWEFFRTMLHSFIVAIPLSYWIAVRWLQDFAYVVPLGWFPFAAAMMSVMIVVFLTILYQTLRTARVNPATALKQE